MWALWTWCTELECLAQRHLSRVDVCQHGDFTPSAPAEEWPLSSHLTASANKECVLFLLQQTSWKREYKDVCVCFRRVLPSGHSLSVTSGQFALAPPLSISHCSSSHLLFSHAACAPERHSNKRQNVRTSLLRQAKLLSSAKRRGNILNFRSFGATITSRLLTSAPPSTVRYKWLVLRQFEATDLLDSRNLEHLTSPLFMNDWIFPNSFHRFFLPSLFECVYWNSCSTITSLVSLTLCQLLVSAV